MNRKLWKGILIALPISLFLWALLFLGIRTCYSWDNYPFIGIGIVGGKVTCDGIPKEGEIVTFERVFTHWQTPPTITNINGIYWHFMLAPALIKITIAGQSKYVFLPSWIPREKDFELCQDSTTTTSKHNSTTTSSIQVSTTTPTSSTLFPTTTQPLTTTTIDPITTTISTTSIKRTTTTTSIQERCELQCKKLCNKVPYDLIEEIGSQECYKECMKECQSVKHDL